MIAMRLLLAAALLLTAGCASTSEARLDRLTICNDSVRPIAFTAAWETGDGVYASVRGYLPGRGTDTVIEQDGGPIPDGTVFHFASQGEGFQDILRYTVIHEVRKAEVTGSGRAMCSTGRRP